ncbi:MAG: thioredoxin [Candidatus Nanoarchaeia archaeon]|nr:thioredoxin [Candidatus Nanoarchaeia archaeon]MDD5741704.1 thioredoxin [Candidatus Nanoarchaeia archaeon]
MVNHESAMEVTKDEFEEIINNSHKLVVVDFYAEWCMPCVMLSPVIEELAESKSMKEVKFTKINVDDNEEISRKYGISGIPCLVIFKKGKEVSRIVGNQTAEVIEEKIKKFL